MNVRLFSDLHLEFDDEDKQFDPGTGDVLVLAGDICNVVEYDKYHRFFEKCVMGYNKVFYIMGNHEHYGGVFEDSFYTLKARLPRGITLLHDSSEFYNGVHFVGATLWTNMNNLDMATIQQSEACMNDYRIVTKKDGSLLNANDTISSHMASRDWFEQMLPTLNGPVFMITHHAPSPKSVKGRYSASAGAYASDMESLIKNHPSIKHWVHGHIHENNSYMIGECRVVSNPRGYHGMELNRNFDPRLDIGV